MYFLIVFIYKFYFLTLEHILSTLVKVNLLLLLIKFYLVDQIYLIINFYDDTINTSKLFIYFLIMILT
jgi:hypothetical protein